VTDDQSDPELEALVAASLVKRGELIPTTVEEVLDADASFDGALPESLQRLHRPEAASVKVSSLAEARSRRRSLLPFVGTFVAGAAAAAVAMLALREPPPPMTVSGEPAGQSAPATSTSATASATVLEVPTSPCEGCCAGASCASVRGELASCPTGRKCVPCEGIDDPDAVYRLRLGNLRPTEKVDPRALESLDVCVSVGGSPWSCEPAFADAAARPRGRLLAFASRVDDLVAGVAMELRIRGKSLAYGSWRAGLRITPGALCRGVGVVLEDEKGEHLGGLSLFLERTYYVELGRREERGALEDLARRFSFGAYAPRFLPLREGVTRGRFALTLGPFDRGEAELLRAELLRRAGDDDAVREGIALHLGDDYVEAPL
jgi:hypothetical protein